MGTKTNMVIKKTIQKPEMRLRAVFYKMESHLLNQPVLQIAIIPYIFLPGFKI